MDLTEQPTHVAIRLDENSRFGMNRTNVCHDRQDSARYVVLLDPPMTAIVEISLESIATSRNIVSQLNL